MSFMGCLAPFGIAPAGCAGATVCVGVCGVLASLVVVGRVGVVVVIDGELCVSLLVSWSGSNASDASMTSSASSDSDSDSSRKLRSASVAQVIPSRRLDSNRSKLSMSRVLIYISFLA